MSHLIFSFVPILILCVYLTVIFGVFYFIYKWVTAFISLKQEHNDLLREILKKMESK